MSDENATCPPELEGGPDEGFADKSNVLKNDPKFQLDKKIGFVFLSKINLSSYLMI